MLVLNKLGNTATSDYLKGVRKPGRLFFRFWYARETAKVREEVLGIDSGQPGPADRSL